MFVFIQCAKLLVGLATHENHDIAQTRSTLFLSTLNIKQTDSLGEMGKFTFISDDGKINAFATFSRGEGQEFYAIAKTSLRMRKVREIRFYFRLNNFSTAK